MINIKNSQRKIKLDLTRFKKHAETILKELGYQDFDLGIWFTTNKTLHKFNKEYRHKDKPTDIISFPFYPNLKAGMRIKAKSEEEKNLGDLIISAEYVKKDAERLRFKFEDWLDHILVHGICHLLGYDHYTEKSDKVMTKLENKLLDKLKN